MASNIRTAPPARGRRRPSPREELRLDQAASQHLPEKVIFWDRNAPGRRADAGLFFTVEEKVEIAKMLDDLGVGSGCGHPRRLEEGVRGLQGDPREGTHNTVILAASRAVKADIDACVDAGAQETSISSRARISI